MATVFSSSLKFPSLKPNPFAERNGLSRTNQAQSQQLPQPPHSSFSPIIKTAPTAPPFRNPAFTTPRKPFDELVLSEASGPESSPVMTDTSEIPNDTPDLSMGEINLGTITASKIDKALRYGKAAHQSRRNAPGRG